MCRVPLGVTVHTSTGSAQGPDSRPNHFHATNYREATGNDIHWYDSTALPRKIPKAIPNTAFRYHTVIADPPQEPPGVMPKAREVISFPHQTHGILPVPVAVMAVQYADKHGAPVTFEE